MNKRGKLWSICALTLAVVISGLINFETYAADAVKMDRKCSVELRMAADFAELDSCRVQVNLYQVASIKETGEYEALAGFENLGLDQLDDKTTAADWEAIAAKAKKVIDNAAPTKVITLTGGKGTTADLGTGMYLLVPQEVKTAHFTYIFKESMISLPNNYYYEEQDDTWVYDLTGNHAIELKADRKESLENPPKDKTIVDKVKTGDSTKVSLICVLLLLSGSVLVILGVKGVKKS